MPPVKKVNPLETTQKFWVVMQQGEVSIWNDGPHLYIEDLAQAKASAEYAAALLQKNFYLLEAIAVVGPSKPPVQWQETSLSNNAKS